MKADTHPNYKGSPGHLLLPRQHLLRARPTMVKEQYHVEVCSARHPFHPTGKRSSRYRRSRRAFRQKYGSVQRLG